MNSKLIINSLIVLISFPLFGQNLSEISRVTIPFEPSIVSKDRQGYLYISNNEGTIHKLNLKGEIQSTFRLKKEGLQKYWKHGKV